MEPSGVKRNDKRIGKVGVFGEKHNEIFEKYNKLLKRKTTTDVLFIINSLKKHFIFFNLSNHELEQIVSKMFYCQAQQGEFIFRQGDEASSFFIIEKGKVEILVDNKHRKSLVASESFGELALLYNAPRSASVRAVDETFFWAIDRTSFKNAVEEITTKDFEETRKFIENIKFFEFMTKNQKNAIAGAMTTQKFFAGQIIVSEGDMASSYYIIKSGSVSCVKGVQEVRRMVKGESFGEQALSFNTNRTLTVKAYEETICLALGRESLISVLGDQIKNVARKNLQRWAFEKDEYLSKLTNMQVEKLIENMKMEEYKAQSVVFSKGQKIQNFGIILGCDLVLKTSNEVYAARGTIIGGKLLTNHNESIVVNDDCIFKTDGEISTISIAEFEKIIGGKVDDISKSNDHSFEKRNLLSENKYKEIAPSIKLDKLLFIKALGEGQFGSVFLVKDPQTKNLFALKSVSKLQIAQQNIEKHLIQEKNVLETLGHPLILPFVRTFKDENNIYFLTEFVKGMELFDVIREIGLLSPIDSQFYIGSLILVLEYMHHKSIIYRDLKPENIMIDSNGSVVLIDMGTAKLLVQKNGVCRTNTILGTPNYMAPEIFTGKGYSFQADLWSVGVCLYEFMCGMVPFGEDAEDPYAVYEEIVKKKLAFPNYVTDKKSIEIMKQLLDKNPDARLGGSYGKLKAHSFFDGLQWAQLLDKTLKAPYAPPLSKLITEEYVQKMEKIGKIAVKEIPIKKNFHQTKRGSSLNSNWDQDF